MDSADIQLRPVVGDDSAGRYGEAAAVLKTEHYGFGGGGDEDNHDGRTPGGRGMPSAAAVEGAWSLGDGRDSGGKGLRWLWMRKGGE